MSFVSEICMALDQAGFDSSVCTQFGSRLCFENGCYYFQIEQNEKEKVGLLVAIDDHGTLHHHKNFSFDNIHEMTQFMKQVVDKDPDDIQYNLLKSDRYDWIPYGTPSQRIMDLTSW
jgi:hypothetical protein